MRQLRLIAVLREGNVDMKRQGFELFGDASGDTPAADRPGQHNDSRVFCGPTDCENDTAENPAACTGQQDLGEVLRRGQSETGADQANILRKVIQRHVSRPDNIREYTGVLKRFGGQYDGQSKVWRIPIKG